MKIRTTDYNQGNTLLGTDEKIIITFNLVEEIGGCNLFIHHTKGGAFLIVRDFSSLAQANSEKVYNRFKAFLEKEVWSKKTHIYTTTYKVKPEFDRFIVFFYLEVPIKEIYREIRKEIKSDGLTTKNMRL